LDARFSALWVYFTPSTTAPSLAGPAEEDLDADSGSKRLVALIQQGAAVWDVTAASRQAVKRSYHQALEVATDVPAEREREIS
jgi:hypothetical protein